MLLGEERFDYATLQSLTAQLCHVLQARGLEPGSLVLVESRSATLLAFMLHASLAADYVLCPLDPRLPDGYRQRLLDQLDIDLMVIAEDAVRPSGNIDFVTDTELLAAAVQQETQCVTAPAASAGHRRLLLASSGSSGVPGLVSLSDHNLRASVSAANERLGLSPASVWLDCLPLVHIGGLSILLRCLGVGASVVLHEGFDAAAVMRDLGARQVTHISLVPAMLAQLLELETPPPAGLQVALVGGAPLHPVIADRALAAGWPVWVTYGMTETASMLTARPLSGEGDDPRQVGLPLKGLELRIDDDVIQVRGEAVRGSGPGNAGAWFSTGDRGRLDEAGRLIVLGRRDHMLLSGGEKVDPQGVERLLAYCPGVDEVAVTGCKDPVWGEKLVAVYSGEIDEVVFDRLCRDSIDGVMRPRMFLRVDALPRTANGKLDRAALRRLAQPH